MLQLYMELHVGHAEGVTTFDAKKLGVALSGRYTANPSYLRERVAAMSDMRIFFLVPECIM